MAIATELPIASTATALDMANEIFGAGVTVHSATYTGDALSSGIYSGGDAATPDVTPSDGGIILSTGYVADFTNSHGGTNTNMSTGRSTNTSGVNGDADLDALAGTNTFDGAILEASFTPDGSVLTLDFVLSSEEFPEYFAAYNDTIGVWVNGVQATITVGDGTASVANINDGTAENLYVDNTGDQFNTEMDGFTVTLSFTAPVNPGVPNTIKIGVADGGDSNYDTNLLIAADSAQTAIVAGDDSTTLGIGLSRTINVLDNDTTTAVPGTLTITHINDVAVVAGDTVILPTGQSILLNADGTLTITADADAEVIQFNYTIEDVSGEVDAGIVEITQQVPPCFVAGTLIDTRRGALPVENLRVGDLVWTRDDGFQPIKWIGSTEFTKTPFTAPIQLDKSLTDGVRDVSVSPQHKVLISTVFAELLFGEREVFVRAQDLIGANGVCRNTTAKSVTYYHMLFENHQIVATQGILSESFQPGPQSIAGFSWADRTRMMLLFPRIDRQTFQGYGRSARLTLRAHEAKLLLQSISDIGTVLLGRNTRRRNKHFSQIMPRVAEV
jgi:hypothetical protein